MSTARVVAGRYSLIRPIGRGSAAVVYVARDQARDRHVAVKVLPARPGLRGHEVDELARDVRAASALDEAGVASVLDAGLDETGRDLYFVTELLHGQTLREVYARGDAVSEARRLDLLEGALEPLSRAHALGFVHGDLTASNVFAARRRSGGEVVTLLDMGLSPLLLSRPLTAPGLRLGATRSMAPEVISGGRRTQASDIWSFGVMLYEALTGRQPFAYEHFDALVHHVCHQPHLLVDDVHPEADTQMARLVDLCLEKEPRRRPPDGRALMRLMKTLRGGIGTLAGSRVSTDTVMDQRGAAPQPPPDGLEDALRRSPRDPDTHRALLAHYTKDGVTDGAWLAATALDFLGSATRREIQLHHMHRRPESRPGDRGLDAGGWAALLHPDQDPRIDAVWSEVVEAVAQLHQLDDETLGLARAPKLDLGRPRGELASVFARAVSAIRPGTLPRLYLGKAGSPPRHLPAAPPASMFPRGFEEPLPSGSLAFAVGRHTAYYRSAHRVCTVLHEPEALEAMFETALRLGLGHPAEDTSQASLTAELARCLSEARRASLRAVCARLGAGAQQVDLGTWRRAVELSCCRAGVVLGADLEGAAWMLRWNRERQRIPPDDAVDDLLTFWTSGAHVRIRHMLGLSVGASS